MLQANMKSVIKYAIELDIDYIESFLGYEGDKVLEIITKSKTVVDLIESYAKNLPFSNLVRPPLKGLSIYSVWEPIQIRPLLSDFIKLIICPEEPFTRYPSFSSKTVNMPSLSWISFVGDAKYRMLF